MQNYTVMGQKYYCSKCQYETFRFNLIVDHLKRKCKPPRKRYPEGPRGRRSHFKIDGVDDCKKARDFVTDLKDVTCSYCDAKIIILGITQDNIELARSISRPGIVKL